MQPNTTCGSRAIGYRQALELLQRCHADPSGGSLTPQAVVSTGAALSSSAQPSTACLCSRGHAPLCQPLLPALPTTFLHLLLQHHLPCPALPCLQIDLVKSIQAASRKLCHKQMSWFRDEEMFRWVLVGLNGGCAVGVDGIAGWDASRSAGRCSRSGLRCSSWQLGVLPRQAARSAPCSAGCSFPLHRTLPQVGGRDWGRGGSAFRDPGALAAAAA